MINMIRLVLLSSLFQVSLVYGETYKCRSFPNSRVEYTSQPCPNGSITESVSTTVFLTNQPSVDKKENSSNPHQKTLDRLVDEAITRGNLRQAKELAVTSEQWEKIRKAETPKDKTSAEIQAEIASSENCKLAKRSYEVEAFTPRFQNQESIDAKKRIMYSACVMREPDSINLNNTVNVYR